MGEQGQGQNQRHQGAGENRGVEGAHALTNKLLDAHAKPGEGRKMTDESKPLSAAMMALAYAVSELVDELRLARAAREPTGKRVKRAPNGANVTPPPKGRAAIRDGASRKYARFRPPAQP